MKVRWARKLWSGCWEDSRYSSHSRWMGGRSRGGTADSSRVAEVTSARAVSGLSCSPLTRW